MVKKLKKKRKISIGRKKSKPKKRKSGSGRRTVLARPRLTRSRKGGRRIKKKKSTAKTVRHRRKRSRITPEIIQNLIDKSRGRGFITEQEIIKAVPRLEEDIEGLEELYERLKDSHVRVLEKKDYIDFGEEKQDEKSKKKLKMDNRQAMQRRNN